MSQGRSVPARGQSGQKGPQIEELSLFGGIFGTGLSSFQHNPSYASRQKSAFFRILLALLSVPLKRNPRTLLPVIALILVMRFADFVWVVMPSLSEGGFHLDWLDFTAPLGIGGLWLWMFLGELPKRPLLPVNSPYLEDALQHGDH